MERFKNPYFIKFLKMADKTKLVTFKDGAFRLARLKSLEAPLEEREMSSGGLVAKVLNFTQMELGPHLEVSGEPISPAAMQLVASQYLGPHAYVSVDDFLTRTFTRSKEDLLDTRRMRVYNALYVLLEEAKRAAERFSGVSHFALTLAEGPQQPGLTDLDESTVDLLKAYWPLERGDNNTVKYVEHGFSHKPPERTEVTLHPTAQLYVHKVA